MPQRTNRREQGSTRSCQLHTLAEPTTDRVGGTDDIGGRKTRLNVCEARRQANKTGGKWARRMCKDSQREDEAPHLPLGETSDIHLAVLQMAAPEKPWRDPLKASKRCYCSHERQGLGWKVFGEGDEKRATTTTSLSGRPAFEEAVGEEYWKSHSSSRGERCGTGRAEWDV